jgi:hypothetical protein
MRLQREGCESALLSPDVRFGAVSLARGTVRLGPGSVERLLWVCRFIVCFRVLTPTGTCVASGNFKSIEWFDCVLQPLRALHSRKSARAIEM